MNTMHEELARAHMAARVGEAQSLQRARSVATAKRLTRRAERLAAQARLALARSL